MTRRIAVRPCPYVIAMQTELKYVIMSELDPSFPRPQLGFARPHGLYMNGDHAGGHQKHPQGPMDNFPGPPRSRELPSWMRSSVRACSLVGLTNAAV